jgi:hypothetical protein
MVEGEIDYTTYTEPELVDMFGRMDPRYAPEECKRVATFLSERDYIVTERDTGPGLFRNAKFGSVTRCNARCP